MFGEGYGVGLVVLAHPILQAQVEGVPTGCRKHPGPLGSGDDPVPLVSSPSGSQTHPTLGVQLMNTHILVPHSADSGCRSKITTYWTSHWEKIIVKMYLHQRQEHSDNANHLRGFLRPSV